MVGERPPFVVLGVFDTEETIVETDFRRQGMRGRDPVHRRLHLPSIRRVSAACCRVVGAAQLDDLAGGVLDDLVARDEVRAAQAHLPARRQPEEFLGRVFPEVVTFDIQLARKRHLAVAGRRILRVVDDVDVLDLVLRVIGDHDLQRPQHAHDPRRPAVEIVAHAVFELRDVDDVLFLGDADARAEVPDRFRRVAAPAQAADGRHARVVPSRDVALLHQLQQLPLAHHGVVQVEPRELDLPRTIVLEEIARPASRTAAGGPRTRACRASA